ncbi:polyubiquitin-tagged protein recognition complex, Npl4 component [Rhizoclosmatium globosum]|uniref:Nuclear protein localization protein 4 n=1 Tax=Rhizoclosmatium globosum TaxID=329046 RepID=A0A1Y2BD60_9FUNG|nr:polyubiquitin-tagged protein recognition complex, Npl4 component [Rhizoclosmatium globosum]|eukprot:ORY32427.1 polyubiquitin-tagged protein recognition complex, Npl4 component [Rhizoclosmatium globosum]
MPPLTIRLRAPTGQARIQLDQGTSLAQLHSLVAAALGLAEGSFGVSTDANGSNALNSTTGLKHGDMLFVSLSPETRAAVDAKDSPIQSRVKQAPIDELLVKEKGTIVRKMDPNFCRHGTTGMCDYCMPLEPYDPKYLEQNKIKHMSYHAYLKHALIANKTASIDSAQFIPPLDEDSFLVKNPCPGRTHEPFPKGICTKCQPSAITLTSQNFRMVDHVEFESHALIDSFIKFWRSTGAQRFGLLYGRYEPYTDKVPLGVKAVVSVIYEPPQENAPQFLQLQSPNPQEKNVNGLATHLGLELVGMIYTDLVDDGTGKGTVVCKRHKDSYFLTSAEALFSAHLQAQYPIASPYSSTGKFGSRFVTAVITGNEEGGIETACYQISNVGVSMTRDGIVEASVDPSLVRVKASSNAQYIPEVFYTFKNEYGIQVKEAAKPTFPVDYLLVTLSHGFPQTEKPTFQTRTPFPIENRNGATNEFQDMHAVHQRLSSDITETLRDFHLLLYISEMGILDAADMTTLLNAVRGAGAWNSVVESGGWQTLVMVVEESARSEGRSVGGGGGSGGASGSGAAAVQWTCRHFFNIFGLTILAFICFKLNDLSTPPIAQVTSSIDIDAPLSTVWAAIIDLDGWSKWNRWEVLHGFDSSVTAPQDQSGWLDLAFAGNRDL